MTGLHKFSLKKQLPAVAALLLICAITWKSNARIITSTEIYSTLTKDTSKPPKIDTLFQNPMPAPPAADTVPTRLPPAGDTTVPRTDSTGLDSVVQRVDTFALKMSKDTLDAPVNYEAQDSAVVQIVQKKILLYGKTKTVYKDITLDAPLVEMDQQTNLVTAYNERDSVGEVAARARFEQGENKFESDTIQFNFKTQKGLTKNTYTQQEEMYVQGQTIKKVNPNTFFVRRGRFTTCNLDHPHFAFVSNKIKVINNKVAVSGPTHPEFEDVPVPLYLPFGYFPLSRGRHSGFLPPQFTTNEDFGVGLEGLGYYKVINDNIDVTLRGNLYSYGGWNANITPTYRRRYRYNGAFNLAIQHTKFNFKGDPDYNLVKTFNVFWSHSVDQRARPGTNFSANVNAGSSKFNQFIPNQPNRNFQNQLSSSIAYSKTWVGKPYNLTVSANHNQNNQLQLINIILPDAGFTVNTLYPFQREDAAGTPKWYEKLGIGYNGVARNQLSFYDTAKLRVRNVLDTLQWGAEHRIPITVALPSLGPVLISPSISYSEKWLNTKMRRSWNDSKDTVETIVTNGFFTDRQMTFGLSTSTAIFGTAQFKNSRLMALRHVARPTVSMNYKPDLSRKHYYSTRVTKDTTIMRFSEFEGNLAMGSGYGEGRFGGMSFGIDNNLEAKWRSRKDTGTNAIKKIRLIDGFGFNSGYNFLADSMKLQPFNLYLRSTLFDKINLTATALLDPYQTNTRGQNVDRFVWQGGRFSAGRLRSGSISLSTDFRSKPRDEAKAAEQEKQNNEDGIINDPYAISDPNLLADQERMQDYMRRNPADFVDFNIPWSVNLAFSLYFSEQLQPDYTFKKDFNASLNFNGDFSLTPKWKFAANGFYDLEARKIEQFTMSINREMHCWQLSINVTPIGNFRFFSFTISPKASMLQDLKVNRTRYFSNF
jgi:hypothetical protein